MSNDLDKTEASCEIIENESSVFSEGEVKYISSSEIEEENTSATCSETDFTSNSEEIIEQDETDIVTETSSSCKRNKIEEEIKPVAFLAPFGSKSVFGSAAKTIVSFNSITANSSLPAKSPFAEEIVEAPISAAKETESSEYEVITGEEDEFSIISMKGKLFEFSPETKDWHERGVGMFKLNKSKKTEKFRIIMRIDGVQKLVLNSNLFPKMIYEVVQEKNIRFSANNFESKIQTFILRMKNSDDAAALEKALQDAIDSLTSEESC